MKIQKNRQGGLIHAISEEAVRNRLSVLKGKLLKETAGVF